MTRYFTFQEGSSHKFWQIEVVNDKQAISFGRVGSAGTVKEKRFESAEACMADSLKLIKEKTRKGYLESEHTLKVEEGGDPNESIGQYLKAQLNSYKTKFLGLADVKPIFYQLYKDLEKFDINAYKTRVSAEVEASLKEWWTKPAKGIDSDEVLYSILFEYDYILCRNVEANAYGIVAWEDFRPHTRCFNMGYRYDFAAGFEAVPGITLSFFDELEKLTGQDDLEGDMTVHTGYDELIKVYVFFGLIMLNEVFSELGLKGVFSNINAKKGFMFMIGEHDMGETFPIYMPNA